MSARLWTAPLLALLLVILAGGCGGGHPASRVIPPDLIQGAAPPTGFPTLALPKSASATTGRLGNGGWFQALAPYSFSRVESFSQRGKFTPDYDPAAVPPTTDFAYAMYAFDVSGLGALAGEVRYHFSMPPAQWGDVWIGLAHWEAGAWDWFQCDGANLLDLPVGDLAAYTSDTSTVVLTVLLLGTAAPELNWIAVGGNLAPLASYEVDPSAPLVGNLVSISAASSMDYDGTLVKYEFDFGDGAGYEDYGTTNSTTHAYSAAGNYTTRVRVTDDLGLTDTESLIVPVEAPPHGVLADLTCDPAPGRVLQAVQFNAGASLPSTGATIVSYEFDFDGDGTPDQTGPDPVGHFTFDWAGTYQATVSVTDDALQSDTATLSLEVIEGRTWQVTHEVAAASTFGLLDAGGQPALAYADPSRAQLLWIRANDALGVGWPAAPTLTDTVAQVNGYMGTALVDGNPALAYLNQTGEYAFSLRYGRATYPSGLPEGAWTISDVAALGYVSALAPAGVLEADGQAAVTYQLRGDDCLYYRQANDADGNSWKSPVKLSTNCGSLYSQTAALIDGRPAAAYQNGVFPGDTALLVRRSTDAGGGAWGGVQTVIANAGQKYGSHGLCLAQYGALTGLTYNYYNMGQLNFAWDAGGGLWDKVKVDGSGTRSGEWATWGLLAGFPAIASYEAFDKHLVFRRALDNGGTTWPTTDPQVVDDGGAGSDDVGQYARLLILNGTPMVAYYNATAGTLRFATYVE